MLYKDAGVDIDTLNLVKKGIGKQVTRTFRKRVKSTFGLFGGIYPMGNEYLIGSVDSVGTKILVASGMEVHKTIGQDIVNHCVNDILTTGAIPLFFMDYIGFSEIEKNTLIQIVSGVAKACKKEKTILIGGETAQLTRFYPKGIYDLIGFIVGKVNKKNFINTSRIKPDDIILGLKSSGLHTNGYSLARKVLLRTYMFTSYVPELRCTVGEELLKIHRSYRKVLEPKLKYVKGLAHITGGGFYDNIKRILPSNCSAVIQKKSWRPLSIFKLIQDLGKVPDEEMYRVFNMGIGMVVVIDKSHLRYFKSLKTKLIGEIVKGNFGVKIT
jgi:phosphoribosylformylglycinamidine cyclo-ligase